VRVRVRVRVCLYCNMTRVVRQVGTLYIVMVPCIGGVCFRHACGAWIQKQTRNSLHALWPSHKFRRCVNSAKMRFVCQYISIIQNIDNKS